MRWFYIPSQVLFTDYGNSEILTLKNIRVLEEKFGEEQPFAICCHLTGVLPAGGQEWTQTSVQFLKDKLNDLDCYICQKVRKGNFDGMGRLVVSGREGMEYGSCREHSTLIGNITKRLKNQVDLLLIYSHHLLSN